MYIDPLVSWYMVLPIRKRKDSVDQRVSCKNEYKYTKYSVSANNACDMKREQYDKEIGFPYMSVRFF